MKLLKSKRRNLAFLQTVVIAAALAACTAFKPVAAQGVKITKIEDIQAVDDDTTVYVNGGETLPKYPGGEEARVKFFSDNLIYPRTPRDVHMDGRVMIGFVVEKDGSLTNFSITQSVTPILDEEALRVAKLMPNWIPGKLDGKVVRMQVQMPVKFMGSGNFALSKKEVKEAKKQRDKYLFNVKLTNKNVSETIHFKLQKGVVFIPVTINGKTYNFAFDTGAITLFSDSVAKELNSIQSEYSLMGSDAAGIKKKMNFYHTDNVQVGSLQFNNVCYAVENLDIFEKHLCMRTDGLLGANILRLLNWEIDFSNQIITVSDKPFLATNYSMEIPFKETFSRNPAIKMEMGEYELYAILDLGNNDLIQIPDSIFFKSRVSNYLKYAKGEGKNTETLFNDETPQNQYVSEIDSLYIGNNLIRNEMVCITPSPAILIGNTFLMKYGKIAINWKQKKIFLGEKNENKVIDNDTIWEFVPNLQDNKLIVSFIWENTNLYKEGVRVGDQIVRINGISTEEINSSQWCEISEDIKNLDNLTVEILKPTGEKITVQYKTTTYKSLIESQ